MRTFRFLLLLVSLLLVFPAPAQAAAGRTVYLVVDGQADDTLASQSMLFRLIDARKHGEIVSFEPYLRLGVMRVELPSANIPASLRGMSVRDTLSGAFETAHASIKRPEGGGGSNIFTFYQGFDCFDGRNIAPYARFVIKVTKGSELIAYGDGRVDETGSTFTCVNKYTGATPAFFPGNKVSIKIYHKGSKTANFSYTSTVPDVNIQSIIKQQATLTGSGPAGKTLIGIITHRFMQYGKLYGYNVQRSTVIANDGQWQLAFNDNLPPSDADLSVLGGGYGIPLFTGGDIIDLQIFDTGNISYLFSSYVPGISCLYKSDSCAYLGLSNQVVNLTLTQNQNTYSFQSRTNTGGYVEFSLYNQKGQSLLIQKGNIIAATLTDSLVVPAMEIQLNRSEDSISGMGPALRWLLMGVTDLTTEKQIAFSVKTDQAGAYYRLIGDLMSLQEQGAYISSMTYFDPKTGAFLWRYVLDAK